MNAIVEKNNLPAALDAEGIILKAVESNVSVETLEKLLSMREKLMAEQAKTAYFTAISQFQSKCPVIKKTKKVKNKDGSVRYSYAPLDSIVEQISPLLNECGLSYTIKSAVESDRVTAICETHHIQGHTASSEFSVPIDKDAFMNDAQKAASADTFAKRYAFCNGFGILTGDNDDDAESLGSGMNIQDVYKKACTHTAAIMENYESIQVIKQSILDEDYSLGAEAWYELDDQTKKDLWVAPSKGGVFTTQERNTMKSTEWHAAYFGDKEEEK